MYLEHRLSALLLQLHLHSPLNTWLQYIAQRQLQAETKNIWVLGFGAAYIREFTVVCSLRCRATRGPGVAFLSKHPPFRYFPSCSRVRYLMIITFMFDSFSCGFAGVTHVKYECDLKNISTLLQYQNIRGEENNVKEFYYPQNWQESSRCPNLSEPCGIILPFCQNLFRFTSGIMAYHL